MLRPLLHASFCALLITPTVDGLRLGAQEGETIRRTLQLTLERELDNVTQTMNGEDQSGRAGERTQVSTNQLEVIILDELQGVDDGKPTKILRTYETVSGLVSQEASFGDRAQSSEFELVSEVEGEQVLFTLEDGEWMRALTEGSSLDAAYLPELIASMDLAQLLPSGDVAEGDEWEAPIDLMDAITQPGGELGLHPEQEDDYDISETRPEPEREGTITVTHAGTSEDNGDLIVLEVVFDTTSTTDLADAMREQFAEMDSANGMSPDVETASRSTEAEGTGTALWNTKAGRLESFTFTIEISEVMEQALSLTPPQGDRMQFETTQESSGTATGEIVQEAG